MKMCGGRLEPKLGGLVSSPRLQDTREPAKLKRSIYCLKEKRTLEIAIPELENC